MELYQIRGLGFTYPGETTPALQGIDLTVNQGEFVVLCGESGCGKTTLLRLLKPTLKPEGETAGEILFCGEIISKTEEKRLAAEIGFVMQNPENQIVCELVWQELAFTLESLGFSNGEIRTRVAEMVSFFGMEAWFHQKVSELSGGQKQLLNLASVMAASPKVLILDEPTAQLDPIAAREFLEMLARINRELGTTVILSEHRLEEAIPLADRVLVLEEGSLIGNNTPRDLETCLKGSRMYRALPAPMRIHGIVEPETLSPLTVGEGRRWLEQFAQKNPVNQENIVPEEDVYGDVVLEAKDLWFRYRKEGADILRGFSMTLRRGELYALLGGNGAGKTTALWMMAGLEKPYRGKVQLCGTPVSAGDVAVLPQDPQTMFVKKTVQEELTEMGDGSEEYRSRAEQVTDLCRIGHLLHRHPYDLSGGEQQRVALGKILMRNPEVLLLDEPTKGMDVAFKEEFAGILRNLTSRGTSILMVSHDVEFAAKYASRCGLLFDGQITDEDIPKRFFGGMTFYTTAAGRMARTVLPEAVLEEDVILACGQTMPEEKKIQKALPPPNKQEEGDGTADTSRGKVFRMLAGILLGILFVLTCRFLGNQPPEANTVFLQILSILEAAGCLWAFFGKREDSQPRMMKQTRKIPQRTRIGILFVCLAVPVTGYLGMTLFEGRKYYLTSILILLETLLPFLLLWGRRKNTARELVITAVLCAIAVAGRMAFSMLPQFKPVLAVVIIAGICFGGETGFLVGAVTAFVSNFFLGQGPWTPWQMLATGMVGLAAGILSGCGILSSKRVSVSVFGFFATLILYGGILNPISVILYQEVVSSDMILSSYLMGLPYDLIHATSTGFFLWVLGNPLGENLSRIKTKYGISREE